MGEDEGIGGAAYGGASEDSSFSSGVELFLGGGYRFQKEGIKKISMVYSSRRPAIITKENHHLVAGAKNS